MNCPNCLKNFPHDIKKKTKCPYCGKFIFVRNGNLLTEEELIIHEWGRIMILFPEFDKLVAKQKNILVKRFRRCPSSRDIIWSVFNELTDIYSKRNNLELLSLLYFQQAKFLDQEGKIKQAEELKAISNKILRQHIESKFKGLSNTSR